MSYEIRIEKLRKVYPDSTVALAGVDLVCPRSKTTSLVGPSGSGKSTILKIVAGLLEASGGRVLFEGRDVTYLPPEKRNIGMVFQSYALFPNMTVRENVEFGMLVRKVSATERRRKAEEALETVQIAPLASRRIHQLSGGQQQRVALARAVVFQPDILLLDEPLSALDAKIRVELRNELARLLRQFGITAVYVTHDQQEAMSLGDQVVVLDKGEIMQIGAPYEIYARPANDFVAKFVGSANLFEALIEGAGSANGVIVRMRFGEILLDREVFDARWPALAQGGVSLMCRPEDVRLAADDEAHARIRVVERIFLGDRIRVIGETEPGDRIVIEVDNAITLADGEIVSIVFDTEKFHFLPRG
jgi:putative spermidine/putrescine transport system ATP-binding protein